jgi:hypothetical protein
MQKKGGGYDKFIRDKVNLMGFVFSGGVFKKE